MNTGTRPPSTPQPALRLRRREHLLVLVRVQLLILRLWFLLTDRRVINCSKLPNVTNCALMADVVAGLLTILKILRTFTNAATREWSGAYNAGDSVHVNRVIVNYTKHITDQSCLRSWAAPATAASTAPETTAALERRSIVSDNPWFWQLDCWKY